MKKIVLIGTAALMILWGSIAYADASCITCNNHQFVCTTTIEGYTYHWVVLVGQAFVIKNGLSTASFQCTNGSEPSEIFGMVSTMQLESELFDYTCEVVA